MEKMMIESGEIEEWTSLGVSPIITRALLEENFQTPTAIQALTLPAAILGRKDILGAAETGSGKTLAFGIPVLNGILESKMNESNIIHSSSGIFREENKDSLRSDSDDSDHDVENSSSSQKLCQKMETIECGLVRVLDDVGSDRNNLAVKNLRPLYALILTPTRELAVQIKSHLAKAAKYTDVKMAVVVGGMAAVKQERILSKCPEIVIGTPGRLWELISDGNPHLSQLNSVRYLVIDETDRMLEKGHFQELHNIMERLNSMESSIIKRQTFVFSATLTIVHDIPDHLKRKKIHNSRNRIFKLTPSQKLQQIVDELKLKNSKVIDLTRKTGTADNLTECRIICTIEHKDYYLYYFLKKHPGRTLVFCNSINCVKRLTTIFGILGCKPLPLHACMPQRQRLKSLEKFQANDCGLLIATDVAARGLDIPCIEHVLHYQVPRTSESYIHRSGRTARAQSKGITVLIMEPSEKQFYSRICRTLNRVEDLPIFPVIDHLLIAVKERVNLAREIDKLELTFRRSNSQKGWLQKAARDMDILLEDGENDSSSEKEKESGMKKALRMKRCELTSLMKRPIFPKSFCGKYLDTVTAINLDQRYQKAIDVVEQFISEDSKLKNGSSSVNITKSKRSLNGKGENVTLRRHSAYSIDPRT